MTHENEKISIICSSCVVQVFIVSGGRSGSDLTSSTETWTRGSSAWTPAADLPSPRYGLAGGTIDGQFLIIGDLVQVLE